MRVRSQAFGFLPHPYNLPTNSVLRTEILIDKENIRLKVTWILFLTFKIEELHSNRGVRKFWNDPWLCVCVLSHIWLFATPWTEPASLLCPWNFPDKNIGVGFDVRLQGIFLTHGSNLHLLYWQVDSLSLSHLERPHAFVANTRSRKTW